MPDVEYTTYGQIKSRLDEIVKAAADDGLPMDDALALYEEAVKLGLAASDLIERDIAERDVSEALAEGAGAAEGAAEDAIAEDLPHMDNDGRAQDAGVDDDDAANADEVAVGMTGASDIAAQ